MSTQAPAREDAATMGEPPVRSAFQRATDVMDMLDLGCAEEARASLEALREQLRSAS